MKREDKHIFKKLHHLVACLMVLLFLVMPTLQLIHFHADTPTISSHFNGKPVVDKVTEQCKLCEFLAHKQFKEYQITDAIELVIPIVQTVKTGKNFIAINHSFTLNGFTNKGPPSLFC